MQPAEMMRGTRAVHDILLLISLSIVYVHSFPLQVLPSIPGYIPVYIRHGDQPLEEINLALAEAFHERDFSKSLDLDEISKSPDINPVEEAANNYYSTYGVIDVRQASISENEDKKPVGTVRTKEETANKGKQRHRRKKLPVVKVSPLTEEEQEALEKYKIKISEDIKSPNIMHDSNSDRSESDKSKNKVENSDSIRKIDQIITDESDLPQVANNQNLSTNKDAPRKEQPLLSVLSNVYKVTPSPEILIQLEKERREKESLEEKSK